MSNATEWAEVGTAVRERMTALGITEDDLARKTALAPATIRGVLRGSGQRRRWTLNALSKALDWPFGYLIAIAEGSAPPTVPQTALESIPVKALGASLPLPASQATPFAALLGLVDLGHGASLQAETDALAARLAREMSEGMTGAQRKAVHEFLTKVADQVRWPR
jgi:transcriptional regulator with XRE-family HTH domain